MKAEQWADGGRSSATPPNVRARRSSPLQQSPLRRPERKKPAHFPTVEIGFRSIIIFLTVSTHRRRPLLANNEATQRIIAAWQAANSWRVGRYVIMPDHIHLFCAPNAFPPSPLKNWIAFWKNHITRAWPVAALAAGFLGPAITTRRIVRQKMEICGEQPSASRPCPARRRLALSGRTQCSPLARLT